MKKIILTRCAISFIFVGLLVFLPPAIDKSMNKVKPHEIWPVSDAANKLHQSLIVGDWHADSLLVIAKCLTCYMSSPLMRNTDCVTFCYRSSHQNFSLDDKKETTKQNRVRGSDWKLAARSHMYLARYDTPRNQALRVVIWYK